MDEFSEITDQDTPFTKLRSFIEELQKQPVGFNNFVEIATNVGGNAKVIDSQIESHYSQFERAKEEFNAAKSNNEDELDELAKQGFVPVSMYEAGNAARKEMQKMYGWLAIKQELYFTLSTKLISALKNVNDWTVESKALQGTKDLLDRVLESHKDEVRMRLENMQKNIDSVQETQEKRSELMINSVLSQVQEIMRVSMNNTEDVMEKVSSLARTGGSSGDGVSREDIRDLSREQRVAMKKLLEEFKSFQKEVRPASKQEAVVSQHKERVLKEEPDKVVSNAQKPVVEDDDDVDEDDYSDDDIEDIGGFTGRERDNHKCEVCGKEFGDEIQLEVHLDTAHPAVEEI